MPLLAVQSSSQRITSRKSVKFTSVQPAVNRRCHTSRCLNYRSCADRSQACIACEGCCMEEAGSAPIPSDDCATRQDLGGAGALGCQGLTPLGWAARKGNLEIAECLCRHQLTRGLVRVGAPVAWACYTGQVDLARMLVCNGANPAQTEDVLFGSRPTVQHAASNGQLG
jgi:hypothetical protein